MPARDPSLRVLAAQAAAAHRWGRSGSTEDRARATQPARDGLRARFEREADPDGRLTPDERAARADQLMHAHMLSMSIKAKASRARARQNIEAARAAEAELAELGEPA
jgi:hypothetical protein